MGSWACLGLAMEAPKDIRGETPSPGKEDEEQQCSSPSNMVSR